MLLKWLPCSFIITILHIAGSCQRKPFAERADLERKAGKTLDMTAYLKRLLVGELH